MLTERTGTILNILVEEYINSASPVASEEIARRSPTKVSPATVRNAMARLTDEGYISRPHISAGAVPSNLGYRHYVETLEEPPELPIFMQRRIQKDFSMAEPDPEAWSRQCAAILSNITTSLAVVTVPRARFPRLKHVQLVALEDFLALLVVVVQEARLLRRLVPLDQPETQECLDQTAHRLNELFFDSDYHELANSAEELTPLQEKVRLETAAMLKEASNASAPEHYVDGLRRLLDQPEFAESGRAKALVEMVEERVLLENLLPQVPSSGGVTVYIGEENRTETLHPYAVVICQYGGSGQINGTICVIGPTRMGYSHAIGGVTFFSSLMSKLTGELHRV